jgi:hypothetical protein
METAATALHFLAMFGATWLMCMRSSDWNTDRWATGTRWAKLVFGAIAWLLLLLWLGRKLFPGDPMQSTKLTVALVAGIPIGVLAYAIVARFWPGLAGAQRMAPATPVHVPSSTPRSTSGWLLLDIRALPALFRRRRRNESQTRGRE